LIFRAKVFSTKVVHAVKLVLRLLPRVCDFSQDLLVNVEGRLLPNHIVVTSEVLNEVIVSYNVLNVSVPNYAIWHENVATLPQRSHEFPSKHGPLCAVKGTEERDESHADLTRHYGKSAVTMNKVNHRVYLTWKHPRRWIEVIFPVF
jgi:hypothetical protein